MPRQKTQSERSRQRDRNYQLIRDRVASKASLEGHLSIASYLDAGSDIPCPIVYGQARLAEWCRRYAAAHGIKALADFTGVSEETIRTGIARIA